MFWWVLNAFLGSVAGIFWKKSLNLSVLPERVFFGFGLIGSLILSVVIIVSGGFHVPPVWWMLAIPMADAIVVTYNSTISQRIYKEEKLSALMPYENLASVLTIVAAFFLFRDTPVATLLIAIAVIAFIFAFSFDFKKREFPRKFGLIVANHSINATRSLAIAYVLTQLSSSTFYASRNMVTVLFVWGGILLAGQIPTLKKMDRAFVLPRLWASLLWAVSAYIGFSLIAELGLVTTILLGFLSMVSTLFIGFFFLGDRPEKRNVFLAVTVASLVALGTFLKVA